MALITYCKIIYAHLLTSFLTTIFIFLSTWLLIIDFIVHKRLQMESTEQLMKSIVWLKVYIERIDWRIRISTLRNLIIDIYDTLRKRLVQYSKYYKHLMYLWRQCPKILKSKGYSNSEIKAQQYSRYLILCCT